MSNLFVLFFLWGWGGKREERMNDYWVRGVDASLDTSFLRPFLFLLGSVDFKGFC